MCFGFFNLYIIIYIFYIFPFSIFTMFFKISFEPAPLNRVTWSHGAIDMFYYHYYYLPTVEVTLTEDEVPR